MIRKTTAHESALSTTSYFSNATFMKPIAHLLALFASVLLIACGGGGGAGSGSNESTSSFRVIPSNLSSDSNPTEITSSRGLDLLPLNVGSQYTFRDPTKSGDGTSFRIEVAGSPVDSSRRTVKEIAVNLSRSSDQTDYRLTALGWQFVLDDIDVPAKFREAVSSIVYMPSTLYSPGKKRTSIRQGSLEVDLDDDAKPDGFQLIFEQVYLGTQTISLHGNTVSVAVFDTTTTFSIVPTSLENTTVTTIEFSREYFQKGYGLIKRISKSDSDPQLNDELYDAQLGATNWREQLFSDGRVLTVDVRTPRRVQFSAFSNKYYAIEGASTRFEAQRWIAAIDPDTAAVQRYPVSGMPSALALTADGSVMYLGFLDTPDIVKLSVPSLAVLATYSFALPSGSLTYRPYVTSISVDPSNPNRIAASLTTRALPGSIGIYIANNGIVESIFNNSAAPNLYPAPVEVSTVFFASSDYLTAFGASGFATEIMRLIDIRTATPSTTASRDSTNDGGFHFFDEDRLPSLNGSSFILRNSLYSASDISLNRVLNGSECIFLSSQRIGCWVFETGVGTSLNVIDTTTYATVDKLRMREFQPSYGLMAKGSAGKVALITDVGGLSLFDFSSRIP
jgi:hypothetical protein